MLSTLTVTNNQDSGVGSLRAEIGLAQDGDTIVFAHGLRGRTIALTSGPLTIGTGVDIEGPGANSLSVSGTDTLIQVFPTEPIPAPVTIAGLRITGGSTSLVNVGDLTLRDDVFAGNRGAFRNSGTATVVHSIFVDNHIGDASAGLAFGGAIFNTRVLTISSSRFTNNSAEGSNALGGAINSTFFSTLTIAGTTFEGNRVDGSSTQGGAINLDQGATLNLSGSTFANNTAATTGFSASGGAIAAAAGLRSSRIDSTAFLGNHAGSTAPGATGFGGAIEVSGTLTVSDSLFSGNAANGGANGFGSGGAILNEGSFGFPPPVLNLVHDLVVGNVASGGILGNGGGFANLFGGSATITGSSFLLNKATGLAGQGGAGQGGGIFNQFSRLSLGGDLIAFNTAIGGDGTTGGDGEGGGVYTSSNASNPVTIADTLILANTAIAGQGGPGGDGQGVGGGLFIDAGPVTLSGQTRVVVNRATTADDNVHGTHN